MDGAKDGGRFSETPTQRRLSGKDAMPGGRASLTPGTLAGPPPDPQSDENRDPPPIMPSGSGLYRRTVDLKQNNVSPTGNAQRAEPASIDSPAASQGRLIMNGTKARDIFIVGLRNQHAVENQAIELLERQIGRLENYPEMTARMREHLAESKQQAQRIESLLADLGTSGSSVKDTAMSGLGNIMALGHTIAPDEVVKNSFANYAFEHYEIASYLSLLALADAIGHAPAQTALNQSLREEEAMAQWIADHIAPTTLRYVERTAAGQRAGV